MSYSIKCLVLQPHARTHNKRVVVGCTCCVVSRYNTCTHYLITSLHRLCEACPMKYTIFILETRDQERERLGILVTQQLGGRKGTNTWEICLQDWAIHYLIIFRDKGCQLLIVPSFLSPGPSPYPRQCASLFLCPVSGTGTTLPVEILNTFISCSFETWLPFPFLYIQLLPLPLVICSWLRNKILFTLKNILSFSYWLSINLLTYFMSIQH